MEAMGVMHHGTSLSRGLVSVMSLPDLNNDLTSCETAALPAWPVVMEGTGPTGPRPGRSKVRMGGPGVCARGGGGPWPCHTRSSSPPSLCATQSAKERRG